MTLGLQHHEPHRSLDGPTGFDYRAARLVGPGDRVRGEEGAAVKVLLYGFLGDDMTRQAYLMLRRAAEDSPHVAYALRYSGPLGAEIPEVALVVEAAAAQGMFWAMCDRVVDGGVSTDVLTEHLLSLCLDLDQARAELMAGCGRGRLTSDCRLAFRAQIPGPGSVFVNGVPFPLAEASAKLAGALRDLSPAGQHPW